MKTKIILFLLNINISLYGTSIISFYSSVPNITFTTKVTHMNDNCRPYGSISISNISGSIAPYKIFINNEQGDYINTKLPPGSYSVNIQDALGNNSSTKNVVINNDFEEDLYTKISTGDVHSLALKGDKLYTWGLNSSGELGDDNNIDRYTPTYIGSGFTAISAGAHHNLALKKDSLFAWGANSRGQLGDGTTTNRHTPVYIGSGYTAISAGSYYSLALKRDSLYAWGSNNKGQLGDGTTENRDTPTYIGNGYTKISTGYNHNLALKGNDLYAWGSNFFGKLGDGTTENRDTPTYIGNGYTKISAGSYHNLALKRDSLYAWGYNGYGNFGDGTTESKTTPIYIGNNYTEVSTGNYYSLALRKDSLYAWGDNGNGVLGDRTTENKNIPIYIGSGYTAISAGNAHNLALKRDKLFTWGNNYSFQLGDGTNIRRLAPTYVSSIEEIQFTNRIINVQCNGDANGGISIENIHGGIGKYMVVVNGVEDGSLTSLAAGKNKIQVKDRVCESAEKIANITEPDSVLFNIDVVENITCKGMSNGNIRIKNILGGNGSYAIVINGDYNKNLTNLDTGEYKIKVIDIKGCESTEDTIIITEPDSINFNIDEVVNVTCKGGTDGSISIKDTVGGNGGYEIAINGAYNESLIELDTGEYRIKIRDSVGCESAEKIANITEPDSINFNIDEVVNITCKGGTDGSISIKDTVGGNGGYEIAINGAYNESLTELDTGEYRIKISDSVGCESAEDTIIITEPDSINFNIDVVENITCKGGKDGSIFIKNILGGNGGYAIVINGDYNKNLTNLDTGEYKIKVRDIKGCESTEDTIIITEPDSINFNINVVENITCKGMSNGNIRIKNILGGNGSYAIVINGDYNKNLTNLDTGEYKIKVRDIKGCESTEDTIIITEPDSINFNIDEVVNVTCKGGIDGSISIKDTVGGNGGYEIAINGAYNESLTELYTGEYRIKISDSVGCESAEDKWRG